MIRVEALNHNNKFRAIGIFEDFDDERIKDCIEKNNDYFLMTKSANNKNKKVLWKNFTKQEMENRV